MPDFSSSGSAPPPAPMKTKFARMVFSSVVGEVLDGDVPDAVAAALDVFDLVTQLQLHAGFLGQVLDHAAGEVAVIDVGTDFHAGRGHFLVLVAAIHHQRNPLAHLLVVFGVLIPLNRFSFCSAS
jgi:hypothetical protein